MGRIELELSIKAPLTKVFDLARSVEVHMTSTAHTFEKAVAGRTSGLCEKGDTITWRAKHFGIFQHLTVEISSMDRPHHFRDRMLKGAFKGFEHDHYFTADGEYTLMRDVFDYEAPLGPLGKLAEWLFLDRYMKDLLVRRNEVIKTLAESPNDQ